MYGLRGSVEVLQCDGVVTQIVISKLLDMSACGCLSVVLLYKLLTRAYGTGSKLASQGRGLRPKLNIGPNK